MPEVSIPFFFSPILVGDVMGYLVQESAGYFNALFLGTMSLLRISSVGVSSLLELQEDNHDSNVMAAALANADFFGNSLRLLLFIFSGFSIWILLFILVIGNCLYS